MFQCRLDVLHLTQINVSLICRTHMWGSTLIMISLVKFPHIGQIFFLENKGLNIHFCPKIWLKSQFLLSYFKGSIVISSLIIGSISIPL